ncbi:MAG: hypothetical protein AAF696_21960 [Bacteroidota bacterium]
MNNQVFKIENQKWKSFMISDTDLHLSSGKEKSVEGFEKTLAKSGLLKSTKSISLDSIMGISFNEKAENLTLRYQGEKGSKKLKLEMEDEDLSNQLGEYLGQSLGMGREEVVESTWKGMMNNLLYLIISIGGTIFLALMDNPEDLDTDSGSRKSQRGKAVIKLLHETVGQTGIIIIGTAISLFLAYRIYKRYQEPAKEVSFSR